MNKQKTQSGFAHIIVIAVLAVALVGTLGVIYWQNFANKTDKPTDGVSNSKIKDDTDEVNKMPNDKIDVYENWQTYENSTFNYTVKYPIGWTVNRYQDHPSKPEHNYFSPSNDSKMSVDIQTRQSDLSPKDFASQSYTGTKTLESNEVSIDGKNTYYYRSSSVDNEKNIGQNYIISSGGNITTITMTEKSDNGYYAEDNTAYVDQYKLIAQSIKFN